MSNTNPYANEPVAGAPVTPSAQYAQNPMPAQSPAPQAPMQPIQESQYNGMAIAGFVCSFFVAILGLIFSIIGLNQIKRKAADTGVEDKGKGLAVAGIIISVLWMVLAIVGAIILIVAASSGATYVVNEAYYPI